MSSDLLVKPADSYEPVRKEHVGLAQIAHELSKRIVDANSAKEAVDFLLKIKEKRKLWSDLVKPVIQSAHEAHKKAVALHKEIDQPLKRAEEEIIKPALAGYEWKQEKKRREEEDRLNKIVQEDAERKRKADEEKRKKDSLVNPQGAPIQSAPPIPPPVVPTIVVPKEKKPEGVSYVDNWKAEVVDFKLLVEAVAKGNLPIDVLLPNNSYINQSAKALKGFMNWPGVSVKKERNVRVSTRR